MQKDFVLQFELPLKIISNKWRSQYFSAYMLSWFTFSRGMALYFGWILQKSRKMQISMLKPSNVKLRANIAVAYMKIMSVKFKIRTFICNMADANWSNLISKQEILLLSSWLKPWMMKI